MRKKRILTLVLVSPVAWFQIDAMAELTGPAFTYQGQLKQAGVPINGTVDLEFTLWTSSDAGGQFPPVQYDAVEVTNGLFKVQLDFGDVFNGGARWLEVSVRYPAGAGDYVALSPRQEVTPTPYALALPGLRTHAGGTSPNVVGGYIENRVTLDAVGATIGGGGDLVAVGPDKFNQITDNYGTVSGGVGNVAGDSEGGVDSAECATVGGGARNFATGANATVGGGIFNYATGLSATVGGGFSNYAVGQSASVPGGAEVYAGGDFSFAAGHYAKVRDSASTGDAGGDEGTFVWADDSGLAFESTGPNQFLIRATGGVGIGTNTPGADLHLSSDDSDATSLQIENTGSLQRYRFQVNALNPFDDPSRGRNLEIWGTGPEGDYNVFTATPDGKVGIGTNTPASAWTDAALEVSGGFIAIDNGSGVLSINSAATSFGAGFDTRPDDALDLYAGGAPRIRLTADGKLGVGTTSPTARLECGGAQAGALNLPLKVSNTSDAAGTAAGILFQVDGGGSRGKGAIVYERTGPFNQGDFHILQDAGYDLEIADLDDAVVTVTNTGQVGIGTTTPKTRLHCVDEQAGALRFAMKIANPSSAAGTSTGMLFQVDEGSARGKGAIVYERTGTFNRGDLHILQDTGNNDDVAGLDDAVVTVTNAGRVGIGTSAPQEKLDVAGTARAQDFKFAAPKVHHYSISAADFMPQTNATYDRLAGSPPGVVTTSDSSDAPPVLAPVHLPHGATITHFKAFIYDPVEIDYGSALLQRVRLDDGTVSTIANINSNDQVLGYGAFPTSLITDAVVDNENYAYFIKAFGVDVSCAPTPHLNCQWPVGLEIMGAVVAYTTTEAD